MAVILYKPGNTYTSPRGVRCQFQIFETDQYHQQLAVGWYNTPEECYPDPEPTEDELEEDAIREAAKAAGISNWYNKGIEKLVEELETIKEL